MNNESEKIYSDVCCSDADYGMGTFPIMKLLREKNETDRKAQATNYLVSKEAWSD